MDTSTVIRRWWLPSTILILAILLIGLFLPNLISPSQPARGSDSPGFAIAATPTETLTPTAEVLVPTSFAATSEIETNGTPIAASETNCTHTIYYWESHPESWMAENILIDQLTYTKSQAIAILESENTDVTTGLLKQFIASLLNILKGADSATIQPNIKQASDWLAGHPAGVDLSQNASASGQELSQILADYNNGVTGPGLCADEPATPTPVPTDTPTPTLTPVPTRIPPTATRLPTAVTGGGGNKNPAPSDTPEATVAPTEAPAQTEAPAPTDTPEQTKTLPTDTPIPPPPGPSPTSAPTEAPFTPTSAVTSAP